ncbi:MAG: excinuclease ABC subunit UvrC [Erysipelotrichaceae bacterium]|nr:excinuclease ABC subunit UvrC [Erysipelotrichaceae bacterium]
MNETLQAKLKTLPLKPGCYLMKNKQGTIIYVGKAIKLKNRVNSYFKGAHNYKTTKLVSQIEDFEYIVTTSEKEALLLEINLIKKYRPRFNIMLMDDKSYPYIRLTKEELPTLKVVRDLKKRKDARYFGPYPDVYAARKTYELLMELFPLRRCEKMGKKECLYYHMNLCMGPCIRDIDPVVYDQMTEGIIRVLKGDTKDIEKQLTEKRDVCSEQLEFEKAKHYQDLITSLQYVTSKQQIDFDNTKDIDAFSYYVENGYIAVQGLFVRNGKLLDRTFDLQPLYDDPLETMEAFVMQYYASNPMPNVLLLPTEMDISHLQELLDTKIHQPIKGAYRKFLDMTGENARQHLQQNMTVQQEHLLKEETAMEQLRTLLGEDIHRIELFDNSHTAGSFAVSGLVVYDDGVANKNLYRTYKVHNRNDDMANMKEVVYRRYFRLLMDGDAFPDVLFVDGGMLQIDAAKEVLDSLQITLPVYGLVKDDRHHTSALMDSNHQTYGIDKQSELFFLLTRMQDEVHRFAITFHRKLRKKAQTKSILDEIEGIGEVRKKKLMKHFGSFRNIKEASVEQLREVVPEDVAKRIFETVRQQNLENDE